MPGAKYSYSNTNYTLLGLLVEHVTGETVATEIRRRVITPLGLRDTYLESFEPSPSLGPAGRALCRHYHSATPRYTVAAGGLHRGFPAVPGAGSFLVDTSAANLSPEWAAGGLVASVADLSRFVAP